MPAARVWRGGWLWLRTLRLQTARVMEEIVGSRRLLIAGSWGLSVEKVDRASVAGPHGRVRLALSHLAEKILIEETKDTYWTYLFW